MDQLAYHAEIFANRLKKRHKHTGKWARKNGVTCFRVYDRDIPEVPLVVDLYENFLHIAEFESPHKRLPGTPEEYRTAMAESARRALGIQPENVFFKQRRRTGRGDQYVRKGSEGRTAVVSEGELKFMVNLSDYLDTGLFLDHRTTRALIRDLVTDLAMESPVRFLNLFSYTGSFTVYAAAGGALHTVSVDMSNTYTEWARENLRLNGLPPERHICATDDVFRFLEHPDSRLYDVAVVDPPTFSNSKKMSRDLDIQRDHVELLNDTGRFLRPGGFLLFSTNKRRFRLDETSLESFSITDLTRTTIPPDFRDQRVHHCWLMEKRK